MFDELKTGWFSHRPKSQQTIPRALPGLVTADVREEGMRPKKRTPHAQPFQLTERELNVLRALFRFRVLDRRQIERLLFPNFSAACRRLRALYQHGFVERLDRAMYANGAVRGPAYRLAARGAKMLAEEMGISIQKLFYWGKSDDRDGRQTTVGHLFLEHALHLSEARIAIEHGLRRPGAPLTSGAMTLKSAVPK